MSGPLDQPVLEFYADLPQQGPGSDAETRAVLGLVAGRLPKRPRSADLGCGTGRSTLVLAEALASIVIAIDLSPLFCARLREKAAARGLSALVDVRPGDMAAPPIEPDSLDLLWSEGAAYIVGFAEALAVWRPLVKPGGFCVVSECSWLAAERPRSTSRFWAEAYPAMTTIDGNIARAAAAGYEVEATRVLAPAAWDDYYTPVEQALAAGRADHLGAAFAAAWREEQALLAESRGSYGYVFYVLRRPQQ